MTRVCIIGPVVAADEISGYSGRSSLKFNSLENMMLSREDSPDLIVVNSDQRVSPSFGKFMAKFRDVPKLVVSDRPVFKNISSWIRYPLTYPLTRPSAKELEFNIARALREKSALNENSQLKMKIESLSAELEFFDDIGKTLTSAVELDDVVSIIIKKFGRFIKADVWTIFLRDDETGDLVLAKIKGIKKGLLKKKEVRIKSGEGIVGWVAAEGIPLILPDIGAVVKFGCNTGLEADINTKSVMCIPIKIKGRVIGILETANIKSETSFTKDDLNFMMRLVDHAAAAIDRALLHRKMAELSITDDLTKLFNTRYLDRTLEMELERAKRHSSSLSLIFMDIDHFKNINDSHGHLVGSKILVEVGQLLIRSLRTIDIVARYGGDEFVVVLPQTPHEAAVQIAERIRAAVARNIFLKNDGYSLRLTASFGVTSYPGNARTKEDLLRIADEAMYTVKYRTRNGVYAIV